MSEPQNASAPANWYPDTVPGQLRWWDGNAWTDHVAPAVGAFQPAARPVLGDEVRTDTPWVWVLAALPLIALITLPLASAGMNEYMYSLMYGDVRGAMLSLFGPWYWLSLLLGLVLYAGSVVVAYFDFAALRRLGVVRPFHWAWTFLYGIVYLIGRTVILRKVSRTGYPPLWAGIAVLVVVFIATIVWSVWFTYEMMGGMMAELPVLRRVRPGLLSLNRR